MRKGGKKGGREEWTEEGGGRERGREGGREGGRKEGREEGRKILPFNGWFIFLEMFFDFAWHFTYNSKVIRKGLNGYIKKHF